MVQDNWVSVWARRRSDEVVPIPKKYAIHKDFLREMTDDEARSAFAEIHSIFRGIYGGIALCPGEYGMPVFPTNGFRVYSREWRDSGQAPFRPLVLLYNLLLCGEIRGNGLYVSFEKYKAYEPPPKHLSGVDQKIMKPHLLFNKLIEFGFAFEGLKNNRVADNDIIIEYPDNPNVLPMLKRLADKARYTDRLGDFLCCHFRLMQNNMETSDYGTGIEHITDRVGTDNEKTFILEMNETLLNMGHVGKAYGGVECFGFAYYKNEKLMNANGPYSYRVMTRGMDFDNIDTSSEKMRLSLRVRNVSKCGDYLKKCPESVKRIFTEYSDDGCGNRGRGTCRHGVSYELDDVTYWRCGCCHAPFSFKPSISDIPHYVKLVELGEDKK